MRVYSGSYYMCDSGEETGEVDMHGNELFTGDVVQLWHGNFIGSELEEWYPSSGLTVIVKNKYTSYCDGTFIENENDLEPFTMGIKEIGVKGGDWDVALVKSHSDLVDGEKIKSFGFNFKSA